jgi:DNA repair exonuclease SbcCD nuclease subunit
MIDVLFTDTHFGWKNNSMTWLNSQMNFIYKQFIPAIKQLSKEDTVRVIHLGDVFDSRSTISTYVATKVVQAFKDIRSVCNEFIIVCGNHDFYSPNSDTVNTVKLLLSNLDIDIVDTEILKRGDHVFIPWYVWESGQFECRDPHIKHVFCHADILNGIIPDSVIGKAIYSGHVHIPLQRTTKKLYNLGSCYSLNFADSNSTRGFYIRKDLDNHNFVEFIPNKESIQFHRLYNEEVLTTDLSKFNSNDYIELYISETNMSCDDYTNAIKQYTSQFTHLWIIPQVVHSTGTINEDFKEYDIAAIMESLIPDDLQDFFKKVKTRLNN